MTKEKFLTVRWNNFLTLGLGLILLIYVAGVVSTSVLTDFAAFLGLSVIGVLYWVVVELHSNMRFAWLRKNSANDVSVKQSVTNRLIFNAYNVVWFIPIVLTFTKTIDYRTGFIALFVVTFIRACANLYRNNVLTPEQGQSFPLRIPWIVEKYNRH